MDDTRYKARTSLGEVLVLVFAMAFDFGIKAVFSFSVKLQNLFYITCNKTMQKMKGKHYWLKDH